MHSGEELIHRGITKLEARLLLIHQIIVNKNLDTSLNISFSIVFSHDESK